MATLQLRITGMTCGHCRQKVTAALARTAGVSAAVVDLGTGQADVEFDDRVTTAADLVGAVERAGYGATHAG